MIYLQIFTGLVIFFTFLVGLKLYKKSATKFDLRVKDYIDQHKKPGLYKFFSLFTRLANVETIIILNLVLLSYFIYKSQYPSGTALILASAFASLASHGLKFIFKRRRPVKRKQLNYIGYSFPSGHSTIGICFYTVLSYIAYNLLNLPFFVVALGYLLGLTIALSRVYLSAHWTSDVLFGIALGTVCLAWVIYFYNRSVDIIEIFLISLNFI